MMKRIMIAEDHKLSAELLSRYLEQCFEPNDITIARNGKDLIEKMETEKPDLLLLDLNMPEMDGIKALRKIREKDKKIKIIILSALNDSWIIKETKQYGADVYISKTFNFRNLINVIRKLEKGAKDLPFEFS